MEMNERQKGGMKDLRDRTTFIQRPESYVPPIATQLKRHPFELETGSMKPGCPVTIYFVGMVMSPKYNVDSLTVKALEAVESSLDETGRNCYLRRIKGKLPDGEPWQSFTAYEIRIGSVVLMTTIFVDTVQKTGLREREEAEITFNQLERILGVETETFDFTSSPAHCLASISLITDALAQA